MPFRGQVLAKPGPAAAGASLGFTAPLQSFAASGMRRAAPGPVAVCADVLLIAIGLRGMVVGVQSTLAMET